MDKMKHTPTPWKVVHDTEDKLSVRSENKQICTIVFSQPTTEQKANASFIVKAVNNHEALLEACKEALNALNTKPMFKVDNTDSYKIAYLLDRAIANAEGK